MAEYVAIYAIQSLLSEVLKFNVQNLPELRGRIELIQLNLRKLQSILEIADARQEVDEGVRKWVAETREVAYEIEDLLLETSLFRKDGNILKKYSLFKDVRLEPKIRLVERKISALESDLRVRNIQPRQIATPNPIPQRLQQRRRTYSHLNEEDFVGFEEDVEELVTRLLEVDGDRGESQVVSITGMGGIGKTTLAKKIYHQEAVRSHFNAFAWICISQQWHLDDVLQDILNKLEPEKRKEIKEMKVGELVKELFDVQQRKRCLIVLDDVWDKDVWEILKPAFPTRQNRSKVLITTRNREIARHINSYAACYLYEQRHLNDNESWELLKKKICHGLNIAGVHDECLYGGEDDDDGASSTESFHSCRTDEEEYEAIDNLDRSSSEDSIQVLKNYIDMETLGKEMVGHCAGLPLAIVVLGGVLTTKSTITEWRTVHQNFYSYSRKGRNTRENARVHEVLALSYYDLPYQLKPCFLYLGNFPEDFKIPTQKLYRLWAAEGFISSESDQGEEEEESIMDTGERYLVELVQRCMVQVQVDELTGKFKFCQLHDFTRELCLLKGKEENFLKKVPFRHETNLSPPSLSAKVTSISVARRLSIAVENDFENYFPTANLEHIRSALFFSRISERKNLQPTLNLLCNKSKLLRVLGLERFDLGELSKDIGNLVHLRYLSLKGSQFYKLPSSIGDLKYLQTLDLRVPFLVSLSIPNVIRKLNQLRHLYLPPTHRCNDKLQLSSLGKLEILKNFDTRVSDYKDILKLTKLQKLTAVLDLQTENLEAFNEYLGTDCNHIRESSIRIHHVFKFERELFLLRKLVGHIHLRKLDLVGLVDRLPEHSCFCQNLIKLTLRNSMLKEDPMVTLERLPNLRSLILRKNVIERKEICCSSDGFPQLRFLELQGLNSLEYWRIEGGAMPKLHYLKIDECINLKMVPEGIIFIASLRALVIANMPDAFKNRVQKVQDGGEDYNKIERIPSVKIIQTSTDYMKQLERLPSGKRGVYAELLRSFTPTLIPREWENP